MQTTNELLTRNPKNGLFRRLLEIGVDANLAKKIMSFWMFLESKDFKDIYHKLYLANAKDFGYAYVEAEMVLAFLESDQISTESSPCPCPFTSTLIDPTISLVQILQDPENVYNQILAFHDSVCKIDEEVTSENASHGLIISPQQPSNSTLNPLAKDWTPLTEGPSLEDRSLFMTFSRGLPFSNGEILSYFRRNYGDCIEAVFIHQPRDREPEFGKIVFKFSWIPTLILKDKEFAKIKIGDKTLGLKKYNPS